MTSTSSYARAADRKSGGDGDERRGGVVHENDISIELARTLKSLNNTMKLHIAALERRTHASPSEPPPRTLSPAPAAGPALLAVAVSSEPRPSVINPADLPRPEKTTVYCRIVFVKIGEVDTLRDRFTGEAVVTSRWRERQLDGKRGLKPDSIDWTQYWSPKLFVQNLIGEAKETIHISVKFDSNGQASIYEKRRVNGTFHEFMELYQFPFDTQDLTVTMTSERLDKEVEIVEDPIEKSALNIQSFAGEQEWVLHNFINTWRKIRIDENKTPKTTHCGFSSAGKVSRRSGFFIWNILVVMFLICSLSFTTFSVDINLPQNRLQLAFILLLTTVSFKFVVNQSLPMISYLTYMDKYILSCMAVLCLICVWHAIVPVVNGTPPAGVCCTDTAVWVDKIALFILGSLYVGFHFAFVLIILIVLKMVRDEVEEMIKERLKDEEQKTTTRVGIERDNSAFDDE